MSSPSADSDPVRFTATEVATSLLCPRLFWFGRVRGKSTLGRSEGAAGVGTEVHRILEELGRLGPAPETLRHALKPRARVRREAEVRRVLEDLVYRDLVRPRLEADLESADGDRWLEVWERTRVCLGVVTRQLVANAAAGVPVEELVRRTLVAEEVAMVLDLPASGDRPAIRLSGSADAVWHDHGRDRTFVVEYKTRPPDRSAHDVAQGAIYHWMLEATRGVPSYALLLHAGEERPETLVVPSDLSEVVAHLEDEHLASMVEWLDWTPESGVALPGPAGPETCTRCAVRAECHRWLGPPGGSGAEAARPDPAPEPGSAPAPGAVRRRRPSPDPTGFPEWIVPAARRIAEVLRARGIRVRAVNSGQAQIGPSVVRFAIELEIGEKVSRLQGAAGDLQRELALASPPWIDNLPGTGLVGLDWPRPDPEPVELVPRLPARDQGEPGTLPFPVGVDPAGALCETDLAAAPHLLVAGATRSGKTVFLLALALSLAEARPPRRLQLDLVDPKATDLVVLEGLPHLSSPPRTELDEAMELLGHLVEEEMPARTALLKEAGCRDLGELLRIDPVHAPAHRVVLIDEYFDLVESAGKRRKQLEGLVGRLLARARSVGIHLVLATQRPDRRVVTGTLKNNLPVRVAFRVPSWHDSTTILGCQGAETLVGCGDMLFSEHGILRRLQGLWIPTDQLRRRVAALAAAGSGSGVRPGKG